RTGELPDRLVDAGGLHHGAVAGDVAVEHGQAAVGGVGVLQVAHAPGGAVEVEGVPAVVLRVGLDRADVDGGGVPQLDGLRLDRGRHRVPVGQPVAERAAVDRRDVAVEQPGPVELAQDGRDAARPVDVLDVVFAGGRGDLAQAGHPLRDLVDLLEPEVDLRLAGRGQDVEDRVGGAAHRHVERHRVLERLTGGDRARQHRLVVLLVAASGSLDGRAGRP